MIQLRPDQWLLDARSGARILTHAPGVSAAAILLIALVIGGNATVYSMINSILVSPASGVNRRDLVASYMPAWRASRVNVVDALRQE
jgi:hypothetical protein